MPEPKGNQMVEQSRSVLPIVVAGDVGIDGVVKAGDILGGAIIESAGGAQSVYIEYLRGGTRHRPLRGPLPHNSEQKVLSSEQALARIADAVRRNLEQLQLNMEQARKDLISFSA